MRHPQGGAGGVARRGLTFLAHSRHWAPSSVALSVAMALVPGAMLPMSALAQSGSAADLAEIVVTARKREESLQDVPIAVTAFSSEQLVKRGISELEDVAMATPGLVFEDFSSSFSAAPVMRGLTQVNVSSEVQNVATFVDGVYLPKKFHQKVIQSLA